MGGVTWRYELAPDGDGTLVTETYDVTTGRGSHPCRRSGSPRAWSRPCARPSRTSPPSSSRLGLGRRRRAGGQRDRPRTPACARVDELLAAARSAALNYPHPASTLGPEPAPGLPDRSFTREVAGSLDVAASTLRAWAPHQGIGRVVPADAPVEVGTTVLVVAPFGPLQMAVPDRVVGVVDEPDRFGFAYGTLEGHAEVGEELFLAQQVAPGQLLLTIRIHARPGFVPRSPRPPRWSASCSAPPRVATSTRGPTPSSAPADGGDQTQWRALRRAMAISVRVGLRPRWWGRPTRRPRRRCRGRAPCRWRR